jgi:pimeloyl-ACP methyl ester carboxylesterase
VKGKGLFAALLLLAALSRCSANEWLSELRQGGPLGPLRLERMNRKLNGRLVDYTHNHGADRRIWSEALGQKRDMYVYLPPEFDPRQSYPLIIWLHGFGQDEHSFAKEIAPRIDQAIACGKLPPHIIASPDGSLNGHECLLTPGSFFLNSAAGRFEDFVMQDVWNFLFQNYPIRPEREAHVVAGVSMGGGSAYNLGIKYRDRVGAVVGVFPPLNTRWIDCHGRYMGNFDPNCWGWRTDFSRRNEVIGRFYGVVTIRLKRITDPLYGRRVVPKVHQVARENPIEMLDLYHVQPGELAMFIGYGGKDQFNIDAQVESFLYIANERGLPVEVSYVPQGKHNYRTAFKIIPDLFDWLAEQLRPYAPAYVGPRPR